MAAPREFDVAIVGKGSCVTITLGPPYKFGVFKELVVSKFGLTPSEMTRLELRRVDEEPAPSSALRLFEAAADSPIELTKHLIADGVQYIVGKIAGPAGAFSVAAHEINGLRCGDVSSSERRWRRRQRAAPECF